MILRLSRQPFAALGMALLAAMTVGGCHKAGKGGNALAPIVPPSTETPTAAPVDPGQLREEIAPEGGGRVRVPAGELVLAKPEDERIDLSGGSYVRVAHVGGVPTIDILAIADDASYAKLAAVESEAATGAGANAEREYQLRLAARLEASAKALVAEIGSVRIKRLVPRLGFFTASMKLADYQSLATVKGLPVDLVVNPVVMSPLGERAVRKMDAALVADVIRSARDGNASYSGLERMGVPQFLETVTAELGGKTPDGANVNVGITDTGITLNHPAFTNAEGKSRVAYLRDFTGEGRLYFNPAAKFVIETATAEDIPEGIDAASVVVIDAEAVRPVAGAVSQPIADDYIPLKTPILVSDELKAALSAEGVAARLAVTTEAAFKLEAETIDLNANGKVDDLLLAIVVQTADETAVYLTAVAGEEIPDFRRSPKLRNWNDSQDLMSYAAEKFGLDIGTHDLSDKAGNPATVLGASIVGFDPGNHGTHVAGIASGRKTIANDADGTLARGVAPNAPIMMNRVCANNGGCNASEAIVDLALSGAELINMSLGGLSQYNDGYSVQDVLIDRITQILGTLFVISAGNEGPGKNTVGSPSVARLAISVGAAASSSLIERQYQWPGTGKPGPERPTTEEDFLLFFSSRGPTAAGGFKPEITAPGTELSAVQLNSAEGHNAGLDVYWGTSMAAPSATGALALLLDAAKLYNAANPSALLPIDARTIKRVVVASARPFDVDRFDPATGTYTRGQYTWIDQGLGMIDLPRAWAALKAERDARIPSALKQADGSLSPDIDLDYQVRVLRTGPNGIPYDGLLELPPEMLEQTGPRFGRGIWLDADAEDSLVQVQIARRLPQGATRRADYANLQRLLPTTQDKFVLKTVFYGSNKPWIKAGTRNELDCADSPTANLNVSGLGAIDAFHATGTDPRSISIRESLLLVCVDRATLASLPAGDHGALIFAYRSDGERTEAHPSFTVPVYVTIPHKTLAGAAGYEAQGVVQSFGVARHYVRVPEGISVVTVSLEVPEATVDGAVVKGCQAVRLYAYEAANTATPAEIEGPASIAANCADDGKPTPEKRVVTYSRTAPTAGVWDLHVFGRYQFPESSYKLTVSYAKVEASVAKIEGEPAALDGSLSFKVLDASFDAQPSAAQSVFALNGFQQSVTAIVATGAEITVPDADGKVARQYDATVTAVTISTDGSPGNDIDLYVVECADEAGESCEAIAQSAGATDVETLTLTPVAGKWYQARVVGYNIAQGDGSFRLAELRSLGTSETGTIAVEDLDTDEAAWTIRYGFDQEASALLKSPLFASGKFQVVGDLTVKSAAGGTMVRVPVEIKAPAAVPPTDTVSN